MSQATFHDLQSGPATAQVILGPPKSAVEMCARCKGPIGLGELFHQVRRMTDDYQDNPEFWTSGDDLYIVVHDDCPVKAETFNPDWTVPPGWILREELKARGMSQAELARQLDRPLSMVNEIINARKAITPETAIGLERVLEVSADFWVTAEGAYRLDLARGRKPLGQRPPEPPAEQPRPPMAQRNSIYTDGLPGSL